MVTLECVVLEGHPGKACKNGALLRNTHSQSTSLFFAQYSCCTDLSMSATRDCLDKMQ